MKEVNLGLLEGNIVHQLNQEFVSRFQDKIFPSLKEVVLDIGSGDGQAKISMNIENYIGLDLNIDKIRSVNDISDIDSSLILDCSVSKIPLEDNSIDVVMALGFAFWQIDNGMNEVARVLKPGGSLVIRHSKWYNEAGKLPYNLLIKSGFLATDSITFNYKCNINGNTSPTYFSSTYLIMNKD